MITKTQAVKVLEQYMYGKDTNQPNELEIAFTDDAVVTFDIKPSSIYFPPQIQGRKNISETMFGDFHNLFSGVKSYYLSTQFDDLHESQIKGQKWLVAMTEQNTGLNRIGTGSYDWLFEKQGQNWKIKRVHIVIEEMVSFSNNDDKWMENFQSQLTQYPWAQIEEVIIPLLEEKQLSKVVGYLKQPA